MRAREARHVRYAVLAAVASAFVGSLRTEAQVAIVPPPEFSACWPASPPMLPQRWRAVGLMAPLLDGQLDIGEFVFDGAIPAMRATVYGLQSGVVDLLITENDTYHLTGSYRDPVSCASLGRKFALPSRAWLPAKASCVGEAPVSTTRVQWWKAPGQEEEASWHWIRSDTRLPWRSLFVRRSADPAVIGDYAMTNFPEFAPLAETNLGALRDLCTAQAKPSTHTAAASAQTARDLMAIPNEPAAAERAQRVASLVPGLSHDACSLMQPVRWPEKFVASAIITPNSFSDNPYSGLIYYDWPDAASQFAILWQGIPAKYRGLVALRKGIGYQPARLPSGAFQCRAIYPGMVRPDWATSASCQCKGVLQNNPQLSPNETTQIFACPIKWQAGRIMWNWYTKDGRPIVFAEAAARGIGAMLADYHQWLPGQKVPLADFNLPPACTPENGAAGGDATNPSCSDCHTTR